MSLGSELANGWLSFAVGSGRDGERQEQRSASNWQTLKSALLVGATSVVVHPASAQQAAEPVPLPPLNVETTAKKKAAAKKGAAKKAAPVQQASPAPQSPPVQAAQQADPLPGRPGRRRRAASTPISPARRR